jgi:hypothetical protein
MKIGAKMAEGFTPNHDDMRRAEIVLDDAFPYELDMLDAAARFMQSDQFKKLANPKNEIEWLTRNAAVECFWTHARCLIEFFNRPKNKDFSASSALARDFTDENFRPSGEMQKLWGAGRLSEQINEQVSHVGFCRKAEQFQKLRADQMVRVKAIIDKEVEEFDRRLQTAFRPYWKTRQRVPLVLSVLGDVSSTATWQMGIWKNY